MKNLSDEAQTLAFGKKLAHFADKLAVIYLHGPLGAGKTTLTRGFLQGLGYPGKVKSPTYTLVETYHFDALTLHHFDLYRLNDPEELEYIGFSEYFNAQSLCLIEWPEQANNQIPTADLICELTIVGEQRGIALKANTAVGEQVVLALQQGGDL